MKILCVLKSYKKNEFNFSHVLNLKKMCERYLPGFDFYCLSDMTHNECNIIPLTDNLPTWWSKIELFKITGPCLYFDLDIIIKKSIDVKKFLNSEFICAKDCFASNVYNTSIMYWKGDMSFLYEEYFLKSTSEKSKWRGDQNFVTAALNEKKYRKRYGVNRIPYFQQVLSIGSYKADIHRLTWGPMHGKVNRINKLLDNINKKPDDYDIIMFHGHPRPWDLDPAFAKMGLYYYPYWL